MLFRSFIPSNCSNSILAAMYRYFLFSVQIYTNAKKYIPLPTILFYKSTYLLSMKKIFETIVPGWKGTGLPKEFPAHVRFFLSASVIVAHLYSLFMFRKLFGMLTHTQREQVILKLYHHPNASIRSIVQFWKLTAFMTQC